MKLDKINQAKRRLTELEAELRLFLESSPYVVGSKLRLKTMERVYYVQSVKEVPKEIALVAGDVIQNLRSALDHMVYQHFLKNPNSSGLGRHIAFPIGKDLAAYERIKYGNTSGISKEAKDLIDLAKPYKNGNDTLWKINELNNIDKHRLLVTVGSSFSGLDLGALMTAAMQDMSPELDVPDLEFFVGPEDNLFPLQKGSELFVDAPNAKPINKMRFSFGVVLHEPGIVEGEPIIRSITNMVKEVELVANDF